MSAKDKFLTWAPRLSDVLALIMLFCFGISYLPLELLNGAFGPATGGDTVSHFWPLYTLANYGIPSGEVRIWNPGNMAGEPQLLHYFPLPFLIMYTLSFFFSFAPQPSGDGFNWALAAGFNWGTVLPILALPFGVYFALRGAGSRFPAPILAAAASTAFLYDESYSIWGGNALSTLSGQFAHMYALVFYLLAVGAVCFELRRGVKIPILSSLALAAVATSHAYLELFVPALLLAVLVFLQARGFLDRLRFLSFALLLSLLLSGWFLVPMILNQPWTTPLAMSWEKDPKLHAEMFPEYLRFAGVIGGGLLLLVGLLPSLRRRIEPGRLAGLCIWLLPAALGIVYFRIFPKFGLVDVRAMPQVQLFLVLAVAELAGVTLGAISRTLAWFAALPLVIVVLAVANGEIEKYPHWLEWNYSGWQVKPLWSEVERLASAVRGDLSQPRIVYEHSEIQSRAGSNRVFEMLPILAGRATLESVYLQANILSKPVYYLQALISEKPSCPYSDACASPDLSTALPLMRLLGVGEVILSSPPMVAAAERLTAVSSPELVEKRVEASSGVWRVFSLTGPQHSLVTTLRQRPVVISSEGWRERFFSWFKDYNEGAALLLVADDSSTAEIVVSADLVDGDGACRPQVKVHFGYINLQTECPGKLHLLKFAYHPTWRSSVGDRIMLASPGFIAVVPSVKEQRLEFGRSMLWSAAEYLSLATAASLGLLLLFASKNVSLARFRRMVGARSMVLLIGALTLMPDTAYARTLNPSATLILSTQREAGKLRFVGSYRVTNNVGVELETFRPKLEVLNWNWEGDERQLRIGDVAEWQISSVVDPKTLGCFGAACLSNSTGMVDDNSLPIGGNYPVKITKFYRRLGQDRLRSAVEVAGVWLNLPLGSKTSRADFTAEGPVSRVFGEGSFRGDGYQFAGSVRLVQLDPAVTELVLSFFTPVELSPPRGELVYQFRGVPTAQVPVAIENVSAEHGDRTDVMTILQWQRGGVHEFQAVPTLVTYFSPAPWNQPLAAIIVVMIGSWLLYYYSSREKGGDSCCAGGCALQGSEQRVGPAGTGEPNP